MASQSKEEINKTVKVFLVALRNLREHLLNVNSVKIGETSKKLVQVLKLLKERVAAYNERSDGAVLIPNPLADALQAATKRFLLFCKQVCSDNYADPDAVSDAVHDLGSAAKSLIYAVNTNEGLLSVIPVDPAASHTQSSPSVPKSAPSVPAELAPPPEPSRESLRNMVPDEPKAPPLPSTEAPVGDKRGPQQNAGHHQPLGTRRRPPKVPQAQARPGSFSPNSKPSPLLQKAIQALSGEPWFKATMSRADSEKYLQDQPVGSFVVRPSSLVDAFSLSHVEEGGVGHAAIHVEAGPCYRLEGLAETHHSMILLLESFGLRSDTALSPRVQKKREHLPAAALRELGEHDFWRPVMTRADADRYLGRPAAAVGDFVLRPSSLASCVSLSHVESDGCVGHAIIQVHSGPGGSAQYQLESEAQTYSSIVSLLQTLPVNLPTPGTKGEEAKAAPKNPAANQLQSAVKARRKRLTTRIADSVARKLQSQINTESVQKNRQQQQLQLEQRNQQQQQQQQQLEQQKQQAAAEKAKAAAEKERQEAEEKQKAQDLAEAKQRAEEEALIAKEKAELEQLERELLDLEMKETAAAAAAAAAATIPISGASHPPGPQPPEATNYQALPVSASELVNPSLLPPVSGAGRSGGAHIPFTHSRGKGARCDQCLVRFGAARVKRRLKDGSELEQLLCKECTMAEQNRAAVKAGLQPLPGAFHLPAPLASVAQDPSAAAAASSVASDAGFVGIQQRQQPPPARAFAPGPNGSIGGPSSAEPDEWKAVALPDGRTYYWHLKTNAVSWVNPSSTGVRQYQALPVSGRTHSKQSGQSLSELRQRKQNCQNEEELRKLEADLRVLEAEENMLKQDWSHLDSL